MKNDELKLIRQAIINEIEGYEFYKMAKEHAVEKTVKEAFETLAEEERKHVEWLTELMNHIHAEKTDSFNLSMVDNPPSPGIFKWDNIDRKNAGLAVSVFGIGMQMEEASVKFYLHAADESRNEDAKALYRILAAWEQAHYEQFMGEYETLTHEYWSNQGFAPF